MRIAIYGSLLLALTTPLAARWAAAKLTPVRGAMVLLISSVCSATVWVWGVGLIAFALAGHNEKVASLGHWSAAVIRQDDPVPQPVSRLAWAAVAVGLIGAAGVLNNARPSLTVWRAIGNLPQVDRITVLPQGPPVAFVAPGLPGRIVVGASLLARLTADERRILVAHEYCHVRSWHWLIKLTMRLSAGVAPQVWPSVPALDTALERWADESAANQIGDRRLTARAIAHAALIVHSPTGAGPGVAGGRVSHRVEALLRDAPPPRWLPAAVPLLLAAGAVVLGIEAARDVEALFEAALAMRGSPM